MDHKFRTLKSFEFEFYIWKIGRAATWRRSNKENNSRKFSEGEFYCNDN